MASKLSSLELANHTKKGDNLRPGVGLCEASPKGTDPAGILTEGLAV